MKTLFKIVATCLVSTMMFTGCKKDTGPVGPQGPAGAPGNANVYAYTFSVDLSQFSLNTTNYSYKYYFNPTSITGNVSLGDKDAVLMYFTDNGSVGTYHALPYDYYFDASSAFIHVYYDIEVNTGFNWIRLNLRHSAGIQPYTTMSGSIFFKMVIIKGLNRTIKPTLPKDLSYESIKKVYNLKD